MGGAPLLNTSSVGATSNNSVPAQQPLMNPASSAGLITIPPPPQQQASGGSPLGKLPPLSGQQPAAAGSDPFAGLAALSAQPKPMQATPTPAVVGGVPPSQPQPLLDPLSVLDNITMPLETIKPSKSIVLLSF